MSFYNPVKDFVFNRYPIKVRLSVTGVDLPMVAVNIVNQTPTLIVYIHAIRVHYGDKWCSRALTLFPAEQITLKPKEKAEWVLPYDKTILSECRRHKKPPRTSDPNKQPGIDSPAQLFNAIGMGDKHHSWIEIDFNEYSHRKFLKSKVKDIFDAVGKQHREMRERKIKEDQNEQ